MSVFHDIHQQQFLFFVEDQTPVGKLQYRYLTEQKIEAFSTQVDTAFRGKGIAEKLYNALIEFAQQEQLKIKPSCHYIERRMVRSHSDFIA